MKVLVLEDNNEKWLEVFKLLQKYGLDENYDRTETAQDGFYSAKTFDFDYDLFICDLDVPRNISFPTIDCETEGYNVLREKIKKKNDNPSMRLIPTIIFSPVELAEKKVNSLRDDGYPVLGKANNGSELDQLIDEKFFARDDEEPDPLTQEESEEIFKQLLLRYGAPEQTK